MKYSKIILSAVIAATLAGCSGRFSHPDTSSCKVSVQIDPFYQKLFAGEEDIDSKVNSLSVEYGEYFDDYCSRELRIGKPGSEGFMENMQRFLGVKENREVIATCDSVVARSIKSESERLSDALSCLRYYMPDVVIPEKYLCHFSGFNNKVFIDSAYVSVSIEHYLGSDCRYYPWLEIPVYARRSKNPENISIDFVKAIIYANCPDMSEKDDVLSALVYQGKVSYVLASCFPDVEIWRILGYTEDELAWCKRAQKEMWGFLAEQKLLYTTNPLDKNKLVNEAPFTSFFGDKSPGRAALYCGFQIVCSYVDNHPDVSLDEIMQMSDAQQFLVDARYRP